MTCSKCSATIASGAEFLAHPCYQPGQSQRGPLVRRAGSNVNQYGGPAKRGSRSCYQNGCDHPECRAENARYKRERQSA